VVGLSAARRGHTASVPLFGDVYVNINTPATWVDDRVVSIDLDLDVVRWRDGRVEIIDRDEFESNRVRYRYPAAVVAAAEDAAATAERALLDNDPPLDGVAAGTWIESARQQAFD
jgi:uncharacterized protein